MKPPLDRAATSPLLPQKLTTAYRFVRIGPGGALAQSPAALALGCRNRGVAIACAPPVISRFGFPFEKCAIRLIFRAPPCAAMAINGVEISSSDPGAVPGASTKARLRVLLLRDAGFGGGEIGSTGSVKDDLLPGMVPPSSGRTL
jgi:hypothetical protein